MQLNSIAPVSTPAVINSFSSEPQPARARSSGGEAANTPAVTLPENAQVKKADASREDVNKAVEMLNSVAASFSQSIQFSVDADTRKNIVKVVDRESNQVIRQFPTEEAVSIAKAIDRFQGLLIKDKA